jgi:4-hydroxy-2-oxoheptanedioate aldolase
MLSPRRPAVLPTNRAKAKLASGETVFGCFVRFAAPGLAELLALQGFDFLVLDAEHGGLGPDDCEDLVRAAQLRGAAPIVRVPANDRSTILRYMDIGAAGIHVPMIESAEAAVRAKRSVKYHPEGDRGLGGVRASNYAQLEPLGEYVLHANRETMVVAQIETPQGIARLPEIIDSGAADVAFIGPQDLSLALGHPGETDHPEVRAAIEEIATLVAPSRVALGIMVGDAEGAKRWRDRGARYISVTCETMVRAACRGYLGAASAKRAAAAT